MKTKSILFILPDLEQGGAERVVTNLLNELHGEGYKLYLVVLRKQGYYLSLLPDNVEIIDLKKDRIRQSIFAILNTIRKIKPSIVFSGYGEVNAFISPFIPFYKQTKFIARETNVVSQHVKRKEILFFYRFYKNYDTIIAQSKDMREDLIENFQIHSEKIVTIHNPVNVQYIQEKMMEFVPEEYNRENSNVVSMGNLSYRKGYDELLRVFSYLKDKKIHLYIIGDGPQREEFEKLREELNIEKVHFLGKKNNPFPYLYNAHLYILSSRYEGFPNALLEAGACGLYSLANNCKGGIDEIILPGINGEIFPIENHEGFAKKIEELSQKKYEKQEIEDSISSRYSQEIISKQYLHLFNKLTSNKHS